MTHPPTDDPDDATAAIERSPVSRQRLLRAVLVVVPLGALAYALLFTAPGLDEAAAALRQLQPRFVLLALGCEAVHVLSMGQAYRSGLSAVDVDMPYGRQLVGFIAGYGVGQLLPAGGAVGGAVVGQRMIADGAPRAAAAAAVVLTGTISLLAVALLVSVGLLVAVIAGAGAPALLGVALAAVAVMAGVVAVVLAVVRSSVRGHWLLDRLSALMGRVGADVAAWRASLAQLAAARPTASGLARVVLWAGVAWAGNAGALWAIFAGLGTPLDGDVLLLGFGLQHLVAMIPVSPGGLGLVEAGMAGTYTALGVAGSTAVAGVVGYRLVSFWLPVSVGLTAYLRVVMREGATAGDDGT